MASLRVPVPGCTLHDTWGGDSSPQLLSEKEKRKLRHGCAVKTCRGPAQGLGLFVSHLTQFMGRKGARLGASKVKVWLSTQSCPSGACSRVTGTTRERPRPGLAPGAHSEHPSLRLGLQCPRLRALTGPADAQGPRASSTWCGGPLAGPTPPVNLQLDSPAGVSVPGAACRGPGEPTRLQDAAGRCRPTGEGPRSTRAGFTQTRLFYTRTLP